MHETKVKIIQAALDEAAALEWQFMRLSDVASAASISLNEIYEYFDDKDDILRGFERLIDEQVIEAFEGQELEGDTAKDRLFDILMERFDLLNDNREAVQSILRSFKYDPLKSLCALPYMAKSMAKMLELAGENADGFKGCARVMGLSAIYCDILMRVWVKDDSADLSQVMAALDKALVRGESLAHSFSL
jgi:AcrR family transcriptional regulator